DVKCNGGGTLPQPVQVLLQKRGVPGADPQPFPDTVTEHEAGIEDAHHRFCTADESTIHVHKDLLVTWVLRVIVGAVGSRSWLVWCVNHAPVLPREWSARGRGAGSGMPEDARAVTITNGAGERVLQLSGLTRRFGAVTALDDLSFQVPSGQVVGFLGA